MPKQSSEKNLQRRELIFKAAIKSFKSNGLQKASMRIIAKEAGVSLGNLYQYFPDKGALIEHFIIEANKETTEIYQEFDSIVPFKVVLKEVVKGYIKAMATEDETAIIYEIFVEALRSPDVMAIVKKHYLEEQLFAQKLQQAVDKQRIKLAASPVATARAILSIIESNALAVHLNDDTSLKQATDDAWQVIKQLVN